ncbi:uncharacterized protein LOC125034336 [Penaeus chinensis]|uniref:uncharacterized protein LOC125034336 n=1 Tax=Penaeus chinensis TaxID=139456 RepID=UPI001FB6B8F1|nr:uncharacterized protein LOC125034336 [Penaeus chinensis]
MALLTWVFCDSKGMMEIDYQKGDVESRRLQVRRNVYYRQTGSSQCHDRECQRVPRSATTRAHNKDRGERAWTWEMMNGGRENVDLMGVKHKGLYMMDGTGMDTI